MASETWSRLRSVFERALELEEEARPGFLDEACADEPALRKVVEDLLAADAAAGDFLEGPVATPAGRGRSSPDEDSTQTQLPGVAPEDAESPGGPATPALELQEGAPARLGPYRLVRRLGRGGMGVVYLAVRDDDDFQRRVVVKLVRGDLESEEMLRRLRLERRILAALDHPNIARLIDGGATAEGRPYVVMEYVDGRPIDRYCDEHLLSVEERLALFVKICDAVQYAHRNLIVHRDLKPANILVTAAGEPKLLDFGIGKLLNPELMAPDRLEPTATWHRLLTPQYASPEQVRGKLITTASDVYSLGVLLFKLLTGRHPYRFEKRTAAEIERLLLEEEAPKPSAVVSEPGEGAEGAAARAKARQLKPEELARHLRGDLDAIVAKALRPSPVQRYASPERLAEEIERHRRGLPVEARQGNLRYRAMRLLARHRLLFSVGALVVLLVSLFVVGMWRQAMEVRSERDVARQERREKDVVLSVLLDLLKVGDPYADNGGELTVQEALEQSREPLRRRLREQPLLMAEVLHTTGVLHLNLGLWQRARSDLEEALQLRTTLLGEGHPDVAETRGQLGLVLAELGEETRSLDLTRVALGIRRSELAAAKTEDRSEAEGRLLVALDQHITALCIAGTYAEAAPLAEEAVALTRRRPDLEAEEVASALYNAGVVALKTGRNAEAAELFRRSLALLELIYGEDHLQLATPLNNLGSALRRAGQEEEAERAFLRAIDVVQTAVGEGHPSIAAALNNVASLRLKRGDAVGAVASWRRVTDLLRRLEGEHHPRVLYVDLQILRARISVGEEAAVLEELRRLLPPWRQRLGADHQYLLVARRIEGEALAALGRLDAAAELLTSVVEKLRGTDFVVDLEVAEACLEDVRAALLSQRDSALPGRVDLGAGGDG